MKSPVIDAIAFSISNPTLIYLFDNNSESLQQRHLKPYLYELAGVLSGFYNASKVIGESSLSPLTVNLPFIQFLLINEKINFNQEM